MRNDSVTIDIPNVSNPPTNPIFGDHIPSRVSRPIMTMTVPKAYENVYVPFALCQSTFFCTVLPSGFLCRVYSATVLPFSSTMKDAVADHFRQQAGKDNYKTYKIRM